MTLVCAVVTNWVLPDRHPKDAREALELLTLQVEISRSLATKFEYTFPAYLLTLVQTELAALLDQAKSN